jgi:hypothetical protein
MAMYPFSDDSPSSSKIQSTQDPFKRGLERILVCENDQFLNPSKRAENWVFIITAILQ